MSNYKEETNNDELTPKDILGADVNQSLHHLVGYVWAEGNQNREFPTMKFIGLIQFVFDQHKAEITKLQKDLEKAVECLELYSSAANGVANEAYKCLKELRGE